MRLISVLLVRRSQKAKRASSELMEVVHSRNGKPLISKNGYVWCRDKTNKNGTIAFRCVVKTCSSRGLASEALDDFDERQPHNHPPDQSKVEIRKRRNTLKIAVLEQPTAPMKRLYNQAFADVEDDDNVVNVPPLKSIRTSLYNERSKRLPKLPATAAEIRLTNEWRETKNGADFILVDTEDENEHRIIAFGTAANLRLLAASNTYFMDGTFHTSPSQFYQLFIIHVVKFDTMIPVIYALLPNKLEATYNRLFESIKAKATQLGMTLQPEIVQTDLEKALQNAATTSFNPQRLRACYFHFCQCVWRKVQTVGLTIRYKEDDVVGKFVRRALGLPFLPLNLVDDVWMDVISSMDANDGNLVQFMDYITINFVDEYNAAFPREIWTQFDNVLGDELIIRTNNHLEGFHGKIKKYFGRHPSIYVFIENLKNEQESQELNLRLMRAGTETKEKQKKKYQRATEKLVSLRRLLDSGEISAYEFCGKCAAVSISQKSK